MFRSPPPSLLSSFAPCLFATKDLLLSCRDYSGETRELVQLHSLAVSFNALASVGVSGQSITVGMLRPGALTPQDLMPSVVGCTGQCLSVLPIEKRGDPSDLGDDARQPCGNVYTASERGLESWVIFKPPGMPSQLYVLQSKGQFAQAKAAGKFVGPRSVRNAVVEVKKSVPPGAILEFWCTKRMAKKATRTEGTVIITRKQMKAAVGPVFCGILTRYVSYQ